MQDIKEFNKDIKEESSKEKVLKEKYSEIRTVKKM